MKRRNLLRGVAIAAVSMMLPSHAIAQEEINLRVAWWGPDARTALYNRLFDLYEEQNPGITFSREFADFGPYWTRLATQAAGGNLPDLIVMHLQHVESYASRGAIMALDDYVEAGRIDLSEFSEGYINSGKVGDSNYMIALGLTPRSLIYNPAIFERAGVELPAEHWTWSQWQDIVNTVSEELSAEGIYGTSDHGHSIGTFSLWLGQIGKRAFDPPGLGFTEEDLTAYWQMWQDLREAGALPPPDIGTEILSVGMAHADAWITRGRLATWFSPGNQFPLFQNYAQDELELAPIPRSDDPAHAPFNFAGGAFMSIATTSRHPDLVADVIDWFVNDEEVGVIYAGEHGPPGSRRIQQLLMEDLSEANVKLYRFSDEVSDYVQPEPPSVPQAGQIETTMSRVYDELRFGRIGIEEAVELFFDEAEFILE